jgi:hypothetical protein
MPVLQQITELLFDHIWGQWCSDSQAIMAALPQALQQPMQAQPVLLHFERWLILLKVGAGFSCRNAVMPAQQAHHSLMIMQAALVC